MMKKTAKKGMIPAGYANGGKAKKEYGMKMANGGKAFKPCAGCPMPKKCMAMGKCMKGGK
jgi:hypothetical protein